MIAGLILAAGESSRMGSPKALLRIGGRTFLEHLKCILREAGAEPILIILGHEAERIQEETDVTGVVVLINPDYPQGQLSSVQCGVRHLEQLPAAGILICPVDTPIISVQLIKNLIEEAKKEEKGIIIPTYKGRRGHPGIFARRFFPDILDAPMDQGARWVIRQYPDEVLEIPVENEGILININTIEDYKNL